jgi:hypothetical protein
VLGSLESKPNQANGAHQFVLQHLPFGNPSLDSLDYFEDCDGLHPGTFVIELGVFDMDHLATHRLQPFPNLVFFPNKPRVNVRLAFFSLLKLHNFFDFPPKNWFLRTGTLCRAEFGSGFSESAPGPLHLSEQLIQLPSLHVPKVFVAEVANNFDLFALSKAERPSDVASGFSLLHQELCGNDN